MSATSSLWLKFLIIASTNLLPHCTGSALNSNSNPSNNHHQLQQNHGLFSDGQRNLEAQISRVLGRMDQLELRVGRLQSLIQLRFDNIESSFPRLQLRMELWGDELNRIEEQLSRKWKIMESKLDTMLGNIDTKLDTKLTAVQRDNRRYQEFLSNAFNTVALGQEKVKEKVFSSMNEVNSTLQALTVTTKNFTNRADSSSLLLVRNSDKMLNILQEFVSNASQPSSQSCRGEILAPLPTNSGGSPELQNQTTNQYQLLGNKVTNMFEDLIRKSSSMEMMLKDAVSIANITKKDVHDGFRAVLASSSSSLGSSSRSSSHNSRSYNANNGGGGQYSRSSGGSSGYGNGGNGITATSSELMSAVISEALSSVDTMSNALGKKITELSRSIDERLEMVSMSINGFLESCVRIQDNQPMIEDHIADLLIKIINTVDNSTKSASQLWLSVANQILDERDNFTKSYTGCFEHYPTNEEEFGPSLSSPQESSSSIGTSSGTGESRHHPINPIGPTTLSPSSNNRNGNKYYDPSIPNSSSNSFETLLQPGNEAMNTTTGRPTSQQASRLITQPTPRYEEEEDVFEDNEETEPESEEETATTFPEESNRHTESSHQYRHNRQQTQHRRSKTPISPTRGRVSSSSNSGGGGNGEILTEEEKAGIWTRLVLSQGGEEEDGGGGPST